MKRIGIIIGKIIISGLLLTYLLRKTDLSSILSSMRSAHILWLGICLSLHGVGVFLSAYRWRILLLAQGIDLSVGYLARSILIGFFLTSSFLPQLAEMFTVPLIR